MATHRASKAEKEQRIAQIVRLISNGAVTSELVQFLCREAGVRTRQAHNYIKAARERIIADIDQDRKVVIAELMHTCLSVIKGGMKTGNYSVVLGAISNLRAMGGLDANPK